VICHAIADALLGSLALGDLGTHFPPSDPAWKDADSVSLLKRVVGLVLARNHVVVNVDVMVVLERPKLAPHIPAMTRVLCEALAAPVDAVSVKATTNEGLGSLGRGEGVAAWAVTSVDRCKG
jgi:2-C-methyl-D-erythritol 2,4-cyclodiphosphate synthase